LNHLSEINLSNFNRKIEKFKSSRCNSFIKEVVFLANSDESILDQVESYLKKVKAQSDELKKKEQELLEREKKMNQWENDLKNVDAKIKERETYLKNMEKEIENNAEKLKVLENQLNSKSKEINSMIENLKKSVNNFSQFESKMNSLASALDSYVSKFKENENIINKFIQDYQLKQKEVMELSVNVKNLIGSIEGMKKQLDITISGGAAGQVPSVNVEKSTIEEKLIEIPEKPPSEDVIPCPNCGTLISKDAVMCYACGYVLHPELLEESKEKK